MAAEEGEEMSVGDNYFYYRYVVSTDCPSWSQPADEPDPRAGHCLSCDVSPMLPNPGCSGHDKREELQAMYYKGGGQQPPKAQEPAVSERTAVIVWALAGIDFKVDKLAKLVPENITDGAQAQMTELRSDGNHTLMVCTRQEWEAVSKDAANMAESCRSVEYVDTENHRLRRELAALTERCKAAEEENERLRKEQANLHMSFIRLSAAEYWIGGKALADRAHALLGNRWREGKHVIDALLDEIERLRKGVSTREAVEGAIEASKKPGTWALLTRSPELEHRLGFGDAGKDR
jgi:hypothetical protein